MESKARQLIEKRKKEMRREEAEERAKFYLSLGLYEKVYAPASEETDRREYPGEEIVDGKKRYYKLSLLPVTDEEYEELKKLYGSETGTGSNKISWSNSPRKANDYNGVAVVFVVFAWLVFIGGFLAGVVNGVTFESFAITLIWWASSFAGGMLFLAIAEIIKLLTAIKNKK